MPLIKDGKRVDDAFVSAVGRAEIPASGPVIVGLSQWRQQREKLLGRGEPVGIQLASHEAPAEIAEDLAHFALIALEFPAFTDGRSYSHARILRERYGYAGELRAVGDVKLEQLHFMHRSGFDAFEVQSAHPEQDWQIAEADMKLWYQPTGDARPTVSSLRKR